MLACSVAQLFHAAPNPRVWAKQQTGVIVLIKDHNQRSYFLQFVNIDVSVHVRLLISYYDDFILLLYLYICSLKSEEVI